MEIIYPYLGSLEQRIRKVECIDWIFGSAPFRSRRAAAADPPRDDLALRRPLRPRRWSRVLVSWCSVLRPYLHFHFYSCSRSSSPKELSLYKNLQGIRPQPVACSVRLTWLRTTLQQGHLSVRQSACLPPAACSAWLSFRFGSNLYSLKFSHCCRMAGNVTNTAHASPRRTPRHDSQGAGVGLPGCRWWCDPQSQFRQRQRRLSGEFPQQLLRCVHNVCDWVRRKQNEVGQ